MGIITLDLVAFYGIATILTFIAYNLKLHDSKTSIVYSLASTFIAREYWEIPIFTAGYFGINSFQMPMFFHHLLVIIMFILLVGITKTQFTLPNIALLLITPVILTPILFYATWMRSAIIAYVGRIIGISIFNGVMINGCTVVCPISKSI